ncbi:9369_t:CDS:1, partial [Cetraspora pellucida]
ETDETLTKYEALIKKKTLTKDEALIKDEINYLKMIQLIETPKNYLETFLSNLLNVEE